jgi:hypothetical protein
MIPFLVVAILAGAHSASAQTAVCDGKFHWVDVAGTECLDGSPTGIQYICRGDPSGPLVIDVDSGGACWDGVTCQCDPDSLGFCTNPNSTISVNSWSKADSFDGLSWTQSGYGGAALFTGPTSPFSQTGNLAHMPYCTGDVHNGDADTTYSTGTGKLKAHHRGYRNIGLELPVLKSLFPHPGHLTVYGGSAGAYGIACNLGRFVDAWPSTSLVVFQNAFSPYDSVTTPMLPTLGLNWGAYRQGKDGSIDTLTCPIAIPPGTPNAWSILPQLYYDHLHYSNVRKAWTDDYSDSTLDGFACALKATPDASGSCAATVAANLMEGLGVIGDDPSYRVYFHTGICHGERDSDGNNASNGSDPYCDYDNMIQAPKPNQSYDEDCKATGNQTCFRDWVRGWAGISGYSWSNVK